jgi:hypothetical protein
MKTVKAAVNKNLILNWRMLFSVVRESSVLLTDLRGVGSDLDRRVAQVAYRCISYKVLKLWEASFNL